MCSQELESDGIKLPFQPSLSNFVKYIIQAWKALNIENKNHKPGKKWQDSNQVEEKLRNNY